MAAAPKQCRSSRRGATDNVEAFDGQSFAPKTGIPAQPSRAFSGVDFLQHSWLFADAVLLLISNTRLYFLQMTRRGHRVKGISDMTQSTIEFEKMATAMRERLRPNEARLLADWLRSYVGLSESQLLQKLLQELSSLDQRESESTRTRESWRDHNAYQQLNRKSA